MCAFVGVAQSVERRTHKPQVTGSIPVADTNYTENVYIWLGKHPVTEYNINVPILKKVNKNFFKKWSPDMAYVLGFFAADGYITVNKRGGQFWCIQITDKELLENIRRAIKSEHKISVRLPNKPNNNISYRIQIGSIEMCDDLRKIGFSDKKTKNLAVPNVPLNFFSHFVRGYFDGDGNIWQGEIHKGRKTRHRVLKLALTSCSYGFLEELHNKLILFGIQGGCIYKSKKKQFSRLQYSTINALKLYDFMYNVLGTSKLFLTRKKDVFERYKKMRL